MTPLKLPLPKIEMVSVLQDLTKNITSLKCIENLFKILENFLIRNPQGLISSPISLQRKSLKPKPNLLLTIKKPHIINVERRAILQNITE